MAMYYQGNSEIQADGLHTLYRMNPNYVGCTDSTQHQLQQVEGINIPLFHNPNRPSSLLHHHQQDIIGATNSMITIPRFNYNNWESFDQAGTSSTTNEQRPKNLSLSLSVPHYQTAGCISKPSIHSDGDFLGQSSVGVMLVADHQQSVVMGSKYLKAAQHLLDEVLNAGKEIQFDGLMEDSKGKAKVVRESIRMNAEAFNGAELTSAQRQEILMKRTKLVSMLEEVEQRYRQYHHQMQITVASFEQAAGIGSSKSYTHVALKTISKQFRCLKDTLSKQISALNKNLGEIEKTDLSSNKFKFIVDHQFGRQRSLQQLGMIPNNNNAWRHQRGLPESAVSVLRAWLFENFLHPYPKDSDKQMLAKQTGLTRSQVSNWFINARVRLWKPMVEEMYLEEINKNDQQQSTTTMGSEEKSKTEKNPKKARHDVVAYQDNSPRNTNLSVKKEINNMKSSVRNHYGIEEQKLATGFYGNSNNNNVVSLSLGLPPASRISSEFGLSAENNTRHGVNHGINICDGGSNNIAYEILDFQNRVNKPFSAEQLFPDFLA